MTLRGRLGVTVMYWESYSGAGIGDVTHTHVRTHALMLTHMHKYALRLVQRTLMGTCLGTDYKMGVY